MSRILLADDSPHAQRMGERILRDEGHEVITVSDGKVAMLRLQDASPDLIIADEPTTALDVSVQSQIIALIRRLCRDRGASALLITHDMGVIAETCDAVAVMYAGRLIEIGPVKDVIQRPAHPYTQGLMASIPDLFTDHARLNQIDGAMPRLQAIPKGCAFHPRCPLVVEACLAKAPSLTKAGDSLAACWRAGDGA